MPEEDWDAICKNCHSPFHLGTSYTKYRSAYEHDTITPISTMTFPKGDLSVVSLECPHCEQTLEYPNHELLRPSTLLEKELSLQRKGVESELKQMKSENESLRKRIDDLESETKRLRDNNDKLTENNRILAHVIEDDRMKEAKPQSGASQSGG